MERKTPTSRSLMENMGGIIAVSLGIAIMIGGYIFSYRQVKEHPSQAGTSQPIAAGAVSAQALQQRLDTISEKKKAIEDERIAKIKAAEEAKKQEELAKKRAVEKAKREKLAAEKAAQEKVEAAKKLAAEKVAKEKAEAAKKIAAEKAEAEKKATAEKVVKEKAEAAKKAAAEKAEAEKKAATEKAAKEKAEAAKKAAETKKLNAIADVPSLGDLSSYSDAQASQQALEDFANALTEKMRSKWTLTPDDIPENLQAQLMIRIDESGNVISVTIDKSSGLPLFDTQAISAAKKSSPLALPENKTARQRLVKEGIIANFNP